MQLGDVEVQVAPVGGFSQQNASCVLDVACLAYSMRILLVGLTIASLPFANCCCRWRVLSFLSSCRPRYSTNLMTVS